MARELKPPTGPLRVAHLITDLDVGGAEMMLARLTAIADPALVEHTVISLTSGGSIAGQIAANGVGVLSLDMRPGRVSVAAITRLVRMLRAIRPDVLQTWLYHADLAGLIAGTLARVPAVVWNIRCSHLDFRDYSRGLPLVLRALALASRQPAAVVCNSAAGRRVHENLGYRPRRWELIPNGVDTESIQPCPAARVELRQELGLAPHNFLVGLVARLHPMKGHSGYFRSAALVCRRLPDVHFLALGRGVGTSERLKALVAELGLTGRVHLQEERDDAARVLAGLDVAVSSSESGEGFPNVVIEAMASAVPCVVTDVGDSAAIVEQTGIVVPPGDPAALADGMIRLLSLPESERAALGAAARRRVVTEFSLHHVAGRYQALYEELACTKSGQARMARAGYPS